MQQSNFEATNIERSLIAHMHPANYEHTVSSLAVMKSSQSVRVYRHTRCTDRGTFNISLDLHSISRLTSISQSVRVNNAHVYFTPTNEMDLLN